jgi:hypothetical protein
LTPRTDWLNFGNRKSEYKPKAVAMSKILFVAVSVVFSIYLSCGCAERQDTMQKDVNRIIGKIIEANELANQIDYTDLNNSTVQLQKLEWLSGEIQDWDSQMKKKYPSKEEQEKISALLIKTIADNGMGLPK